MTTKQFIVYIVKPYYLYPIIIIIISNIYKYVTRDLLFYYVFNFAEA